MSAYGDFKKRNVDGLEDVLNRARRKERKMKRLLDKIKVALWKAGALKTVTTSEGWLYVRV